MKNKQKQIYNITLKLVLILIWLFVWSVLEFVLDFFMDFPGPISIVETSISWFGDLWTVIFIIGILALLFIIISEGE